MRIRYLYRTLLMAVVGVTVTLIASIAALILTRFSSASPLVERIIRGWSRAWLWACGCSLEVEGAEHADPSRSYVVVANHISNLDIMACFLALPFPIRFLAKKELFEIPIFASAMRSVGIVSVDRQSRSPIHTQINAQAKELVAAGRSLIIYPEGTRSRQGSLAPFKKGAFTIAVATELPVLPVTIHGTGEAWPPASPWVRGGPIEVVIDPPIETAGLSQGDAGRVAEQARSLIGARMEARERES
jgi:1-acyl-sn-glycerol-3-phosphate acyltransferase